MEIFAVDEIVKLLGKDVGRIVQVGVAIAE